MTFKKTEIHEVGAIFANFQSGHISKLWCGEAGAKQSQTEHRDFAELRRQGSEFQTIVAAIICEASGRQERSAFKVVQGNYAKGFPCGNPSLRLNAKLHVHRKSILKACKKTATSGW